MKILVIYCTHRQTASLDFFLKHGYYESDDTDFYICINDPNLNLNSISSSKNLFIVNRENVALDFGGWSQILLTNDLYKSYDYFILLNNTCTGPFLPVYVNERWTDIVIRQINDNVKLVGPSINYHHGNPHVQSYFMCTDRIGLQIGIDNKIFSFEMIDYYRIFDTKIWDNKWHLIINYEIGYSRHILNAGYNIKSFMKAFENVDFRNRKSEKLTFDFGECFNDMLYLKGYFGITINPYEVMFFKSNRHLDDDILDKLMGFYGVNTEEKKIISPIRGISFKILSVSYGMSIDKSIDVLDKIISFQKDDGNLIIPKSINLNDIFSDPFPKYKKKIFIKFEYNRTEYLVELDELNCNLIEDFNLQLIIDGISSTKIPTNVFPDLSKRFDSLYGVEIGGPSSIINSMGIYNKSNMDCVNYSSHTLWSDHVQKHPFRNFDNRTMGLNYIMEATDLNQFENNKYDFLVASHVLEHIANPLLAIKEWKRVLKDNGTILLILPWKNATFDHKRNITPFSDLLKHYENNTDEHDLSHLDEILELHDLSMDLPAGNIEQFTARSNDNFIHRGLHHHVFDFDLITKCLEFFDFKITDSWLVTPYHQIVIANL